MKGTWQKKANGPEVIVFVHGVLSSGGESWLHENGAYWPDIVSTDAALDNYSVYVFSYYTGLFSGSFSMGNIVDSLKTHMSLDGVFDYESIIFVAHSMGGIIVRKYIVERALDLVIRNKKINVFLVASPSLGSSYADWISPLAKLAGHSQAEALRFVRSNHWLEDLDKEFLNLKESGRLFLNGKEIIEDKFVVLSWLLRRQLVEPFSGAKYFGEPYKVPQSDHFSIAKPSDSEAIQHRLLRHFVVEAEQNLRLFRLADRVSCRPAMPSIGAGARGSLVRMVQNRLGIHVDGRFGTQTVSAVKMFQKANGLAEDGIVGPETWDAFPVLGMGSSGSKVQRVQMALGLVPDGTFGAITERHVMEFQRKNGLLDDGIVGPDTLNALNL